MGAVGVAILAPTVGLAAGAKQGGILGGVVGLTGGAVVGVVGAVGLALGGTIVVMLRCYVVCRLLRLNQRRAWCLDYVISSQV